MAIAKMVRDIQLPPVWKAFAAGTYNFTTTIYRNGVAYGPAMRIVALAASSWSHLKDCNDVDAPLSVASGFVHDSAGVTEITSDQAFIAYFNPSAQ